MSELAANWVYDDNYGFLNENARRLAEVLYDLDPHLKLTFIPERQRQAVDIKPYAIAYFHSEAQPEPSYFISSYTEAEIARPDQILADFFNMRESDPIKRLENIQAASDLIKMKERMERMEEAHEQAKSFLRSPLNTYRVNGKKYDRHTGKVI